jgi:solute carrier family 25 phosphate transporter 23/24/25/41
LFTVFFFLIYLKGSLSSFDIITASNFQFTIYIDLLPKKQLIKKEKMEADAGVSRVTQQLVAGGASGALARTLTAPLDRIKILMQTAALLPTATNAQQKYTGLIASLRTIHGEEGIRALWKGNMVNICRVVPYSAAQFASFDFVKHRCLKGTTRSKLNTQERLASGAVAGIVATTITHPMDVLRLQLSVRRDLHTSLDAFRSIMKEGGPKALFRGYVPTIISLSPFIAINFAVYDTLSSQFSQANLTTPIVLGLGAISGIIAQTSCYPLDTIRRRMQLKDKSYQGTIHAVRTIVATEGIPGLYRGMLTNALKVIPNNAVRFLAFEFIRSRANWKSVSSSHG